MRWVQRYAPSEALAVLGAIAGYLLTRALTDNAAAAAYGAAIGDNLAYYGLLLARDLRAGSGCAACARGLAVEFGPAEILDTALIRPGCMVIFTAALGPVAGVLVAKVVADLIFYAPVIATYELRTRRRAVG